MSGQIQPVCWNNLWCQGATINMQESLDICKLAVCDLGSAVSDFFPYAKTHCKRVFAHMDTVPSGLPLITLSSFYLIIKSLGRAP